MNGWQQRLVTISQPQPIIDEPSGTEVIEWEPLVEAIAGSPAVSEKFWAWFREVRPGRERDANGLVVAKNQAELRLRWRDDVTPACRVTVHGDSDVIYQIIGGPVEVEGRKKQIEMLIERASS